MKQILVTCATSAMGSSYVNRALQRGDRVFGLARNVDKLNDLIESNNTNAFSSAALDFFSSDAIDNAIEALKDNGKVFDELLFIIPRIAPSAEVFPDDERWLETFNHYFILPLRFMRELTSAGLLAQHAKIALISGISSKVAMSNYAINNAVRSAWLGQAKTMALALAEQKISVNTLSLGGVLTESYIAKLTEKAVAAGLSFEQQLELEVSNIPLKQYATIENVCDALESLLGPMSNHMTGQNLVLDGGFIKVY